MPFKDYSNNPQSLEQQNERERLLAEVALCIRQSLNLKEILNTTTAEVRRLLECDRVLVYQFAPSWEGSIVAESLAPGSISVLGNQIRDTYFQNTEGAEYVRGKTQAIADIDRAGLTPCHLQLLQNFQVKATLVVPILMNRSAGVSPSPKLWGLLVAHQCAQPRQWKESEINFLDRLAVQIAIAIQQAELYEQLQTELAERNRAKAALQNSEKQYRLLFESNPNPMWVYDGETLCFLAVNQAAIAHYGYSREEFLGMTIAEIRPPNFIPELLGKLSHHRDKLSRNLKGWKHRKKDGTLIDVEITSNAITWSGKPARVVLITDITERLRAEAALRESERLYATLAEASPVGIFHTNDRGQCTYLNQRGCELLGLTAEEAMGQGWASRLHPEDRDRVLDRWNSTLSEDLPFGCEYRFVRSDGRVTWVFGQAVPHRGTNGKIIDYVGTITDISDRKQTEQALQDLTTKLEIRVRERTKELGNTVEQLQLEIYQKQRSQKQLSVVKERLQYLLSSSPAVIYSCHTHPDFGTTFISENVRTQLGYEPKQFLEDSSFYWNHIHPEDAAQILRQRSSIFNQLKHTYEYRFLHADGTYRWLRDDLKVIRKSEGKPLEIIGSLLDITERKQSEEALQQSKIRFQKMASNVPGMIYQYVVHSDGTDEFIYASSSYQEIYELDSESFERDSRVFLDMVHPDDQASLHQSIAAAARNLQPWHWEGRIVTRSGRIKWIQGISRPEKQPNGDLLWDGLVLDICDRKQAEEKLLEIARLQQAILDGADYLIFSTDSDGIIQTLNATAQRLLGYTAEEAIGKLTTEIFHDPDELKQRSEMRSNWFEESTDEREWTFIRKDGSRFPVLLSVTRLRDADGNFTGTVGIGSDITERKRMEAERQKLVSVVENSSDFIGIATLDGQSVFLNQAGQKLVGLEGMEAVKHTPIWDYLMPEYRDYARSHLLPDILEQGHWEGEIYFRHFQTHQPIPAICNVFVLKDKDTGEPINFATVTRDISDRKQAEAALRESQERLQFLLSSSPTAIYSRKAGGNYDTTFISENITAIAGYKPQAFLSDSGFWTNNIHPEDVHHVLAGLAQLFDRGSYTHEYRFRHVGGIDVWIRDDMKLVRDAVGQPVEIIGSWIDISDRKQAEEALGHSEQRFRSLVANIPGAVYRELGFLEEWKMEFISEEIAEISGYPSSDFILNCRRRYSSIIYPEDRQKVEKILHEATILDRPFELEYRIVRADGSIRWVFEKGKVVYSPDRELLWFDGAIFDISDRKEAQAKLEKRDRYSTALVAVQRQLLAAAGDKDLYEKSLAIIGPVSEASRIYIFENHRDTRGHLFMSQKAEWCASDIQPEIDNPLLQNLSYDEFFPRWFATLSKGEIIQGIVAEFSESEREILEPQNILSILILPLIVKGEFFGFIGFDNCMEPREWEPLEVELLSSTAAAIALAKERQLTQAALEQQLAAVEASIDGIAILNQNSEYIYLNPSHFQVFGYNKVTDLIGKTWREFYHLEEIERLDRDVLPLLESRGKWRGETTGKKQDGSKFPVEISLTSLSDGGLICVCRDITERKQAEKKIKASLKEKEVLLKEIHHRVKNNLQIIHSLLRLQSSYIKDSQAIQMFRDSQNRIRSMALIHELLYRSENLSSINFAEYIQNLTTNLSRAYNFTREAVTIEVNIESIQLGIDTALPCGLIINELVTNALKYAFPDENKGTITIEFYAIDEEKLILKTSDNGIGFPEHIDFRNTESLGLQLICDSTEQLDGTIELDRTQGTTFTICFKELKYKPRA